MKCQDVQRLLVAYLDGEVTPSERKLIRAHLAGCAVCQQEAAALAATSSRLGQALLRRAARAAPSPQAWSRLEARLAREAHPAPSRLSAWLVHLAPDASRPLNHIFLGDATMRKRLAFAVVAVLALAAVGVLTLNIATPVSAQEILSRAYEAQTAVESQGIQHVKTEIYTNFEAMPGPKPSSGKDLTSVVESYTDPQAGKNRVVVTDKATGQVMDAAATDGAYLYTSGNVGAGVSYAGQTADGTAFAINIGSGGPVKTIYRIPQPKGTEHFGFTFQIQGAPVDAKTLFERARQDPNAKFNGEQTLSDGRKVYVIQSQAIGHLTQNGARRATPQLPMTSTLFFDKQTYQLVEQRTTMQQNGKEVIVNSVRHLSQETLPQTTNMAWNLSDLKGVAIVDDPKGEHGPQMPVTISQQELAARTPAAYILKTIPAGYTMHITATPNADQQELGVYHIVYSNPSGDTIAIDGGGERSIHQEGPQDANNTYTTHSGLKLHFVEGQTFATGMFAQSTGIAQSRPSTHAIVQVPDGTFFDLSSTLSRERLQTLAEDLVPLR